MMCMSGGPDGSHEIYLSTRYIGNAPSVQGCGGNGRPSGAEALSFTDADIGMIT